MLMPETEGPKRNCPTSTMRMRRERDRRCCQRSIVGIGLGMNVGAMLLAFVALIAVLNGVLGGIGGWLGMPDLTLELILRMGVQSFGFSAGCALE